MPTGMIIGIDFKRWLRWDEPCKRQCVTFGLWYISQGGIGVVVHVQQTSYKPLFCSMYGREHFIICAAKFDVLNEIKMVK